MVKHLRALSVRTAILSAALVVGLAPAAAASASDAGVGPPRHVGTVTEPASSAIGPGCASAPTTCTNPTGKFASFDISWVDSGRDLYYLADRSNNAVDVIDSIDGSFVKFLGQGDFAGVITGAPTRSGPDGVTTDKEHNVWVGDGLIGGVGDSTLKEFAAGTGDLLANIHLGGLGRADELAFGDVGSGRILIADPNEPTTAFVTLVNTQTQAIIGKVLYDAPASTTTPPALPPAGHGFSTNFGTPATQHGLEQSAFFNGHFFLNVPSTIQNPGGEIDEFTANKPFTIINVFPLEGTCGGTGLAIGPQGDLIAECADSVRVLDANNGHQEASIAELGGADEIWFNPGDNKVYFPLPPSTTLRGTAGSTIGIMGAASNHPFSLVNVPGGQGLHSIAVDANNNRIFVPISDNPDNGGACGSTSPTVTPPVVIPCAGGAGGVAMFQSKASSNHTQD